MKRGVVPNDVGEVLKFRESREILAKMDTIDGGTNNRSESSGSSNNNRLIAIAGVVREFIDEPGGLDLHLGMFIPTIQGQGQTRRRSIGCPSA